MTTCDPDDSNAMIPLEEFQGCVEDTANPFYGITWGAFVVKGGFTISEDGADESVTAEAR